MKSFEQLAKEGYEKAAKVLAQKSTEPIAWHQLLTTQQEAWIAATRHIVEQANQVH